MNTTRGRLRSAAALVAVGVLLAVPSPVAAVECAYGRDDAGWVAERRWLVAVGDVASVTAAGVEVRVDSWYNPRPAEATVRLGPGSAYSPSGNPEAHRPFEVGERYLIVAFRNTVATPEFGPAGWVATPCQPSLPLDHPDAARRLAEAEAGFGSPVQFHLPDTATVAVAVAAAPAAPQLPAVPIGLALFGLVVVWSLTVLCARTHRGGRDG